MTTIRDLLRDFQSDTIVHCLEKDNKPIGELSPDEIDDIKEGYEEIIEQYVQTIKERIVG